MAKYKCNRCNTITTKDVSTVVDERVYHLGAKYSYKTALGVYRTIERIINDYKEGLE